MRAAAVNSNEQARDPRVGNEAGNRPVRFTAHGRGMPQHAVRVCTDDARDLGIVNQVLADEGFEEVIALARAGLVPWIERLKKTR